MELNHSFTVPVSPDRAWSTFEDIASVAECFPGAVVTSVSGDEFQGTAKVKLGPIAMQYAGTGSFLERDAEARRMVLEAKGRDKRGNGTAGATITATFAADGTDATRVEVATDLQITGKPAQFGRGVIQDVSDKLLGQFVDCLQARIGTAAADPGTSSEAVGAAATAAEPLVADTETPIEAATRQRLARSSTAPVAAPDPTSGADTGMASSSAGGAAGSATGEDAIDLGTTVLPVLARSYGPRVAGVLLLVLLVRRFVRHR